MRQIDWQIQSRCLPDFISPGQWCIYWPRIHVGAETIPPGQWRSQKEQQESMFLSIVLMYQFCCFQLFVSVSSPPTNTSVAFKCFSLSSLSTVWHTSALIASERVEGWQASKRASELVEVWRVSKACERASCMLASEQASERVED